MLETLLGAAAAVLASVLFSAGLLLQALEAAALPAGQAVSFGSFRELLARRRWVLGAAVMVAGFAFHVWALTLAPLTVVQPALSAGLVVLLLDGARRAGDRMTLIEAAAVAVIGLGVLGLTLASGERSDGDADDGLLWLALAPLAIVAVLPRLLSARAHDDERIGLPAMVGAGAAYALTGLTTKLVSDRLADGEIAVAALWLALTAAAAVLALIDQTIALHARDATQVGVIIYIAPVIIPVLVAVSLLGETPASVLEATALGISVLAVCAASGILAASRHVTAVAS